MLYIFRLIDTINNSKKIEEENNLLLEKIANMLEKIK